MGPESVESQRVEQATPGIDAHSMLDEYKTMMEEGLGKTQSSPQDTLPNLSLDDKLPGTDKRAAVASEQSGKPESQPAPPPTDQPAPHVDNRQAERVPTETPETEEQETLVPPAPATERREATPETRSKEEAEVVSEAHPDVDREIPTNVLPNDKLERPLIEKLPTGDWIIRTDGTETLFMPNGDRVTVNADGSYDLATHEPTQISSKDGVTTIRYQNGDVVSFDNEGILTVNRGDTAVSFARPLPAATEHETFAQAAEKLVPKLDKDGDNLLSKQELEQAKRDPNLSEHNRLIASMLAENYDKLKKLSNDNAFGEKGISVSDLIELDRLQREFAREREAATAAASILVGEGSFSSIDRDGDGYLSRKELEAARATPHLGKEERDAVQYLLEHYGKLQKSSNDELGFENNGISTADLTKNVENPSVSKNGLLAQNLEIQYLVSSLDPSQIRHQSHASRSLSDSTGGAG